jgi:hypothetical protein
VEAEQDLGMGDEGELLFPRGRTTKPYESFNTGAAARMPTPLGAMVRRALRVSRPRHVCFAGHGWTRKDAGQQANSELSFIFEIVSGSAVKSVFTWHDH